MARIGHISILLSRTKEMTESPSTQKLVATRFWSGHRLTVFNTEMARIGHELLSKILRDRVRCMGEESAKNIFYRRRSKNFSALLARPILLNG